MPNNSKAAFEIINNEQRKNHKHYIKQLGQNSDELILVSPFLSEEIDDLLKGIPFVKKLTVYTVFEGYNDGLNKAEILKKLFSLAEAAKIQLSVEINEDLHGKIYLFYKNGKEKGLIITSANFTKNGLTKNREWGVLIKDAESQQKTLDQIKALPTYVLDKSQIEAIYMEALQHKKEHPPAKEKKLNIKKFINIIPSRKEKPSITYYLKPIGTTKDPFKPGTVPDEQASMGFSSKSSGLRKDDVLICYSVGTSLLVGYYTITEDLTRYEKDNENDRWPWKISTDCLSIPFSKKWWEYNLKAKELVTEFKKANPDIHITRAGGNTLGALQWGRDKIRLTDDFAHFLLEKINEC